MDVLCCIGREVVVDDEIDALHTRKRREDHDHDDMIGWAARAKMGGGVCTLKSTPRAIRSVAMRTQSLASRNLDTVSSR